MSLRPGREAVRRRLSPYVFCSTACQRAHWERRRREARVAQLRPYRCASPGCDREIAPVYGPGRPRRFCSDRCKEAVAAQRANLPRSAEVREAIESIAAMQTHAAGKWQEAWEHRLELLPVMDTYKETQHVDEARRGKRILIPQFLEQVGAGLKEQRTRDESAAAAALALCQARTAFVRAQARRAKRAAAARERRANARGQTPALPQADR